jgi:CBS domain-containing protein
MSVGLGMGDAIGMSEAHALTPEISGACVRDCMHHGVFTCEPGDSLRKVAAIMANQRVHAVVVTTGNGARAVGVVSDLDVVAAVAAGLECTAAQAAATEALTVPADQTVLAAAQLMNEHAVSHLVVVDAAEGYPLGVLSSLDIAGIYAHN